MKKGIVWTTWDVLIFIIVLLVILLGLAMLWPFIIENINKILGFM